MNGAQTVECPRPLSSSSAIRPAGGEGFGTLAERLAEEMALCWRQGERPTAEGFLSRYEELRNDSTAAVKLICEEICLRKDYGQEQAAGDLLSRFPQWRSHVDAQIE